MSQMGAPILHLGDARVAVVRIDPLLVAPLLFPLAVQSRQIFPRGRLNPGLPGQPFQKLLVALAVVTPHNRAQRRIGFQGGGINANPLAFEQSPVGQQSQYPEEHFPVRVDVDQPARPGDRRMIGHALIQPDSQEPPQTQRVRRPPGNAALGVNPLEVAQQQQAKIDPGRQ